MLDSKNAVATQENVVPRLRELEIVGNAVFVTLPSRADNSKTPVAWFEEKETLQHLVTQLLEETREIAHRFAH